MFHQFEIINGKPYFRLTPDGELIPASVEQVLELYLRQCKRITELLDKNTDLLIKIHELETYTGPNCPNCGSGHPIPLFTRVQCPQCNKVYTA